MKITFGKESKIVSICEVTATEDEFLNFLISSFKNMFSAIKKSDLKSFAINEELFIEIQGIVQKIKLNNFFKEKDGCYLCNKEELKTILDMSSFIYKDIVKTVGDSPTEEHIKSGYLLTIKFCDDLIKELSKF